MAMLQGPNGARRGGGLLPRRPPFPLADLCPPLHDPGQFAREIAAVRDSAPGVGGAAYCAWVARMIQVNDPAPGCI
jgi:hypothetical protein